MNWLKRRDAIIFALILFWFAFTVTFAIWWLTFSVAHISLLAELQPANLAHWVRQRHMVFIEGSAWIVLLSLGGAALIVLNQRERLRGRRLTEFFASFSHEVKTSLASLRLQAESLKDDLGLDDSLILNRLLSDVVRLQLQLENSLFLSSAQELKLYSERRPLSELVHHLREQWPDVTIRTPRDAILFGDVRGLRTILSNLIQNARVHGGATEVTIDASAEAERVRLAFHDNGTGFEGSVSELGALFHRPKSTSGSGLGLYICRLLAEKMNGRVELHASNHGFRVDLIIPGETR